MRCLRVPCWWCAEHNFQNIINAHFSKLSSCCSEFLQKYKSFLAEAPH
ncbi:unnamed protein product [Amoebophrya sp. A25]|nr:unnamed protein product [Amoebophrya sp. A25]|eukprot:GSA25T00006206001.1